MPSEHGQWDEGTTIITSPAADQIAHIPMILMISTDLPIPFKLLPFPIKTSFALTIKKFQGKTFELVEIDVQKECFTLANYMLADRSSWKSFYFAATNNNIIHFDNTVQFNVKWDVGNHYICYIGDRERDGLIALIWTLLRYTWEHILKPFSKYIIHTLNDKCIRHKVC